METEERRERGSISLSTKIDGVLKQDCRSFVKTPIELMYMYVA